MTEITQAEAIGYGIVAGTTVLLGLLVVPKIRAEWSTPYSDVSDESYLQELFGSVMLFVGMGLSIELNVKLYEAFERGQWPTELGP